MAEIRVADESNMQQNQPAVDDPGIARAEIEQTRARMSDTIDEIESVLVRKKEHIQDRLDVLSPIRERPLPSLGAAFGAGLLLGLVTGGGDDDDADYAPSRRARRAEYHHDDEDGSWEDRADTWESRTRRLLTIAREQEDEIRDLEERFGDMRAEAMEYRRARGEPMEEKAESGDLRSTVGSLRDAIAGGITGFVSDTFHQLSESRPATRA